MFFYAKKFIEGKITFFKNGKKKKSQILSLWENLGFNPESDFLCGRYLVQVMFKDLPRSRIGEVPSFKALTLEIMGTLNKRP